MALKFAVLGTMAKAFRLNGREALLVAVALCQVGEFAFVLLSLSQSLHVLSPEQAKLLVAVVALSMVATPPLFILLDRVLLPRFTGAAPQAREQDQVESDGAEVIIAGFGRMGNMIGRLLRANHVKTTVLDLNPDVVDTVRKLGLEAYYGDASRLDLLHAAGAEHARLLILTLDNPEKTLEIVETVRKHFPRSGDHGAGVGTAPMPTPWSTSASATPSARLSGPPWTWASRPCASWGCGPCRPIGPCSPSRTTTRGPSASWPAIYGDEKTYLSTMRAKIAEAEDLLKDSRAPGQHMDSAWDNEPLRAAEEKGDLKR